MDIRKELDEQEYLGAAHKALKEALVGGHLNNIDPLQMIQALSLMSIARSLEFIDLHNRI